jgi:O-antigen ligase
MGFSYGIAEMLNAHNQYLETLLDIGWLGLALLLGLLGYGLVWGWRQNKLLALFMLISILAFATESYLEAQKGIVFFTLFWTILGSAPKKQEAE